MQAVQRVQRLVQKASHSDFEFDYSHNVVFFEGDVIHLSPHEADILKVLLDNRARPTPIGVLIQRVYGAHEPDAAAVSIRVAIHSLRKKILPTGIKIRAEPKVGYEIDGSQVPELNRRLHDRILLALNVAKENEESEIVNFLQAALALAESKRQKRVLAPAHDLRQVHTEAAVCYA